VDPGGSSCNEVRTDSANLRYVTLGTFGRRRIFVSDSSDTRRARLPESVSLQREQLHSQHVPYGHELTVPHAHAVGPYPDARSVQIAG
jgi:hypothetical protein